MRLTAIALIRRNLNEEVLKKPYEIGYRGPHLSKKTGTGKPEWPVSTNSVDRLRKALDREYYTMKCLATPYLTKQTESTWNKKYGSPVELKARQAEVEEQERMPSKPKIVRNKTKYDKIQGNVGNLLHKPRTLADHMQHIFIGPRWD